MSRAVLRLAPNSLGLVQRVGTSHAQSFFQKLEHPIAHARGGRSSLKLDDAFHSGTPFCFPVSNADLKTTLE